MSDPERLSKARQGQLEGLLIGSVQDDAPPSGGRARVLCALGVGTALSATSAAATGAATAKVATSVSLVVLAKWLGVGAGVAIVAVGVAHRVRSGAFSTGPAKTTATVVALPSKAPVERTAEPAPAIAEPTRLPEITSRPAAVPAAPRAAPPPIATVSGLKQEIEAIDAARQALAAGDARGALALLDTYSRTFAAGELAPEATVLRIEALVGSGDRSSAEKLAQRFLTASPASPHAGRIRRLLEPDRSNP